MFSTEPRAKFIIRVANRDLYVMGSQYQYLMHEIHSGDQGGVNTPRSAFYLEECEFGLCSAAPADGHLDMHGNLTESNIKEIGQLLGQGTRL
jgi:NADH:ubiquinone oxidoreductase subunit E